jgi:hypothetical protein
MKMKKNYNLIKNKNSSDGAINGIKFLNEIQKGFGTLFVVVLLSRQITQIAPQPI